MSDIIVIGGGIAGLSAAARLSADAKVTVLEQEAHTGYHASGRSAALYEEFYGAPSVVALNSASKDYFHHANGGYLSPRGFLILAREAERAGFDKDCKTLNAHEIPTSEAMGLVPILNPDVVAFAGYHAEAFDIDTDRMMQDFIRVLRANGGELCTTAPVTAITRSATGWQVDAGGAQYTCATLVNAAGAWADQIAEMAGLGGLGITPHRRSMARIAPPGGADTTRWPMFFGVGEAWYAKPDAGALLISPADEDPVPAQDAWADDMVLAAGIERYQEMVTLPVTRPLATWAGLRSFAPDRTLVLGPDPLDEGFVWSAGQGGYGYSTAPAASQLVADLVVGRPPQIAPEALAELRPDRLRV